MLSCKAFVNRSYGLPGCVTGRFGSAYILAYLNTYAYRNLGWCVDKYVRDTGPYVDHQYYARIQRCAYTIRPT